MKGFRPFTFYASGLFKTYANLWQAKNMHLLAALEIKNIVYKFSIFIWIQLKFCKKESEKISNFYESEIIIYDYLTRTKASFNYILL